MSVHSSPSGLSAAAEPDAQNSVRDEHVGAVVAQPRRAAATEACFAEARTEKVDHPPTAATLLGDPAWGRDHLVSARLIEEGMQLGAADDTPADEPYALCLEARLPRGGRTGGANRARNPLAEASSLLRGAGGPALRRVARLRGDVPVPADYDGDDDDDIAVFRPAIGAWYVKGRPTTYFRLSGEDISLTVTGPGVLANDTGSDGHPLEAAKPAGQPVPTDAPIDCSQRVLLAPVTVRAAARYHAACAALVLSDHGAAGAEVAASLALSQEAADPPEVLDRTRGLASMIATLARGPAGVEELEATMETARVGADPHLAERLTGCGQARLFQGDYAAARRHFEELAALTRLRGNDATAAVGLVGAGAAAAGQGDCAAAAAHLAEGVALAGACGEAHTEIVGRIWLAELARLSGRPHQAGPALEGCLARARAMATPYPLALALVGLGRAALDAGRAEDAAAHLGQALAVAGSRALGHLEAAALDGLGLVALAGGDPSAARRRIRAALAVARRGGDRATAARSTYHLGQLARADADLAGAASLLTDALGQFHAIGAWVGVADALDALAGVAAARREHARAARLFGAAEALRRAGGFVASPAAAGGREADLALALAGAPPGDVAVAWHEGGELSAGEAVAYASRRAGRSRSPAGGGHGLTPTERQVVDLVVAGLTRAEVAERLFISPETVKTHVARAYAKLGVRSRRELREAPGVVAIRPRLADEPGTEISPYLGDICPPRLREDAGEDDDGGNERAGAGADSARPRRKGEPWAISKDAPHVRKGSIDLDRTGPGRHQRGNL